MTKESIFPLWTVLLVLMLDGCSHEPSRPPPDAIQSEIERFGASATYQVEESVQGIAVREPWNNGNRILDVLFEVPEDHKKHPLVVYLPGLGQDANSGPLWRQAWVKGGFAVLSLQHRKDAAALSNLTASDRLDLKSIGHQHFSRKALEARLNDVAFALRILEEKAHRGEAPFNQAQTDHFALAGFDLGAQTVQAILGEQVKGLSLPATLPQPRSAILLSPHVDLAQGGIQHRFTSIATPLLVVTGTDDHDPWGISSPSVRSAPFQEAQSGNNYLLTLINGTHRQLAGIDPLSQRPEDQEEDPDEVRHSEEEGMIFGKRGRGEPHVRGTQFSDARRGFGPGYDPRHYGRQLSAVQKISTAFLKSTLSKDPRATEWIRKEAGSWLGAAARIRSR